MHDRGDVGDRGEDPIAERPDMPDYGISTSTDGLLPWSWAVTRLETAHNYWVATRDHTGAPHLAAVWAVWWDGAVWFSTGGRSSKARNLAVDPRCVIAPERADESVVVEGEARRVTDATILAVLSTVYIAKYGSGYPDPDGNPLFAVRPTRAFGVIEAESEFTRSATRWRFTGGR